MLMVMWIPIIVGKIILGIFINTLGKARHSLEDPVDVWTEGGKEADRPFVCVPLSFGFFSSAPPSSESSHHSVLNTFVNSVGSHISFGLWTFNKSQSMGVL